LPRSTRMSIRSPSTLPIYPRHRRRSARHDAGAENKHPKHFLGRRLSSDVRPLCPDVITRLHRAFPSGSGSCADSPACAARRRAMTRFRPRTRRRQPRMARMCPDQKPIADLGLAVCNFGKPGRKARRQGNVRKGSKTVLTAPKRHFRSSPINGHIIGPLRHVSKVPIGRRETGSCCTSDLARDDVQEVRQYDFGREVIRSFADPDGSHPFIKPFR
jgi:hypothetical protein